MIDVEELGGSDEEELVTGRRFSSYFGVAGVVERKEKEKPEFHIVLVAIRRLELERLGLLPGVVGVTEVTVRGGLQVLRLLEVELLDNDTGPQVPVVSDDLDEVEVGDLLAGTVGVDVDGKGLGDSDGVRELDEGSSGETGGDQGLGDPSGGVSGRSVDLGEVLSGESTTSVSTPSTVGVDNDLSSAIKDQNRQASQFESTSTQMAEVYSRQTGVSLGTSDNESARRLDLGHQKEKRSACSSPCA